MSEDYLATAESYRAYLDSLPDVTEEDVYCIKIIGDEFTDVHALPLVMTDAEAIDALDITFLEVYREREKYIDYKYMVAVSPVDDYGERRQLARLEILW